MIPSPRLRNESPDLAERIRGFIATILLNPGVQVGGNTPLLNGLIDSTGLMELLLFLEDEFGVAFGFDDIDEENFGSIDRISRLIQEKVQEG